MPHSTNHIAPLKDTTANASHTDDVWRILATISDPEIPALSITDLGIVRNVQLISDELLPGSNQIKITITPTYSGCPAMDAIATSIRVAMLLNGYKNIQIVNELSPAWTTDWMTEAGKEKLLAYGIAPPVGKAFDQQYLEDLEIACPQCRSINTRLLSQFGSTSCKALFQCNDCKEPFDYFKCH